MRQYLVFRLYGPMASWGQPAVGSDRPTAMQPTRSAILGLLGAALGIKRDEQDRLLALQDSVWIAIKQRSAGTLLRDYHTSQVPSYNKKKAYYSRKAELQEKKLNTVLSSRDYRCDGLWIIAIWLTQQASISLEQLQQALQKPVFTLSLGRKSCPLALPLQPQIVSMPNLRMALDSEFPVILDKYRGKVTKDAIDVAGDDASPEKEQRDKRWLKLDQPVTYYWEGDQNAITDDQQNVLTYHPVDQPIHRQRWQFTQRTQYQLTLVNKEAGDVSL